MLDKELALSLVKKSFPEDDVSFFIDYNGLYLFRVIVNDEDEAGMDPFVSFSPNTGEIKDFSLITDGDLSEIIRISESQEKSNGYG